MNPIKILEEFGIGQVWQPTGDRRVVSRLINAFVTDRRNSTILIRFASPKGTVSRCSLEQMREWVKNNNAITEGTPGMNASDPTPDNIPITIPPIPLTTPPIPPIPTPTNFRKIVEQNEFPQGKMNCFNRLDCCELFIDGPHFYHILRYLGCDADFRKMLNYFQTNIKLVHARYYSSLLDSPEYSQLQKLTDWLAYNGYLVNIGTAEEYIGADNRRRIYDSQMMMKIAVDMLTVSDNINHIIFITGNDIYAPLIKAIKAKGIIVTLISVKDRADDDLRRVADNFINLDQIVGNFFRRRHEQVN
jgi:uncharacterized LabA/DUF88 family protein